MEQKKRSIFSQIARAIGIFLITVVSVLAIIFFVIPGLLSFFWGKDIAPINDSSLGLRIINIPEDENAFYDLEKIQNLINTKNVPTGKQLVSDYLNSDKWADDSVEKLLKDNEQVLNYFDAAVSNGRFQIPYVDNPEKISSDMPITALYSWREISRLSGVKAINLAKNKQYEKALDESLKSVSLGNAIENSQCALVAFLVGIAIKNNGLDFLEKVISMTPSEAPYLTAYAKKLSAYKATANRSPFSIEYMMCKEAFSVDNVKRRLGGNVNGLVVENNFYFKSNMTIGYCFDFYNKLAIELEKECSEVQEVSEPKSIYEEPNMLKWYFTENLVGKRTIGLSTTAFNSVLKKKCDVEKKLEKIVLKINE